MDTIACPNCGEEITYEGATTYVCQECWHFWYGN